MGSRDQFVSHLHLLHRGRFVAAELPILAEMCQKHVLLDDTAKCPICVELVSPVRARYRHIARHLEDVAWLSMKPPGQAGFGAKPEYSEMSIQDAGDSSSASAYSSHRGKTSTSSICGYASTDLTSVASEDSLADRMAEFGDFESDRSTTKSEIIEPMKVHSPRPSPNTGENTADPQQPSHAGDTIRQVRSEPKAGGRSSKPDVSKSNQGRQSGGSAGFARSPADIEASCAICGAPPLPECPHEGHRLKLALDQALERWQGVQSIRDLVLNQARNQIINTFRQLYASRLKAHTACLQTLPCYTLSVQYRGLPPLPHARLQLLHGQIHDANHIFKQGVDEDWRRSCLEYPEVLDYFFSLVEISWPDDRDPVVREPKFPSKAQKRKQDSRDAGMVAPGVYSAKVTRPRQEDLAQARARLETPMEIKDEFRPPVAEAAKTPGLKRAPKPRVLRKSPRSQI